MPLHGKLVVIKRSGVDGTEFPVTASCLFGRNPDCDIRIQLSQVSKEHCKIELNENKEVILTNLSVVNPTRINGQVMRQSERLKHGDLITIIDRSFRFEYPPEPTPKKRRPSVSGKCETLQVLHDQQVRDHGNLESVEKGKSSLPSSEKSCLKDGTNTGNLESTTGKSGQGGSMDVFRAGLEQSEEKSLSPFCELYQIMKQNLDTKSPRKPSERGSLRKAEKPVCAALQTEASAEGSGSGVRSPLKILGGEDASRVAPAAPAEGQEEDSSQGGRSVQNPSNAPCVPEGRGTPASQKKTRRGTPKKFRPKQVAAQVVSQDPSDGEGVKDAEGYETPKARRSIERTPRAQSASELNQVVADAEVSPAKRTSPRKSAGKRLTASDVVFQLESVAPPSGQEKASSGRLYSSKKRKSGDLDVALPTPQTKRKRVSFGGHLSPELFDKRLPPDSPLRKGATPRRSSLSVLQKRHSLLNRASAVGLKQGLCAEKSSPKRLKALESPKKGVASPGATLSPAKSPRVKAKTPSPGKQKLLNPKAKTPSPGRKSPSAAVKTPSPGRKSPSAAVKTPSPGRKSPSAAVKTPSPGRKSPSAGVKTPKKLQSVIQESEETLTPCPSQRGRMSFSDPEPLPETPCPKRRSPSASTPATSTAVSSQTSVTKTPPPRRSLNSTVANQSASSLGRFSVSRIETPSPVANQNTGLPESVPAAACVPETPNVPLRRKSVKLSRKTPQSTRKNVLEVIRSRRSGASRANLKVVSSWADIVKFGASKSEAFVPAKKRSSKGKTVKKTVTRQPKTPAQKVRDHFSTGHAASPVTIVVGRAHARTAPTGCAPKLVPNVALLRKNMAMNEDLTGLAEIFTTPVNMRQKRIGTGGQVCSENPQDVLAPPVLDTSVMNTPEETGEMVISPLSIVSTAKRGSYNNDAIVRLLQEHDSSFTGTDILQGMSDTVTTTEDIHPVEQQDSVSERLVRTPQPLEAVSEVRRVLKTPKRKVQEVVDFRGITRLLKTPRGPKVSREVSLVGVKELLKTPKVKGLPVEDLAGVKRIMRTPKVKPLPVVCTTGVKRLMQTPKQKNEPVEDLIGVKQLLQTPEHLEKSPKQKNEPVDMVAVKSVRTPKQKNEPVEDTVAVKSVRTPKQKNERVEDTVAVKSVRTPKQKNEPVEDTVAVKSVRTPKQKNEPVEDTVAVKSVRTPKQKNEPVEDTVAVKSVRTPKQKNEPVEDTVAVKSVRTPKQKNEPVEDTVAVKSVRTPKQKNEPVEDTVAVKSVRTPKQKNEPVEDTVAVKSVRTPKQKNEPVDTVAVKSLVRTPKQKNEPVEDTVAVKSLVRTPKQKNEPVEDTVAVKSLVRTPKQKNEPVEDTVAVKSLVRTPKQKNEPVEDTVAVKSLVRTPKQKNEPVEDMVGVKRLLQTPKQKNEPVEDMVGVKRLLKSPKVKGVPVEKKFGIGKLMKSPRLKGGVAVEDYTGLQELMEEPLGDSVPQVGFGDMSEAGKVSENPISPESRGSAEIRVAHEKPENLLAEIRRDNPKKSARRGRKKQSENISVGAPKMDDSVSPVESACNETEAAATSCAAAPQTPARAAKSRGRRARTAESAESAASEGSPVPFESSVEANDAREPEPAVSDTPSVKGRRGRRAVDVPENPLAPPLVRKAGKGRLAKGKVDEVSVAAETQLETPAEDVCVPENPPAPPLVRKAGKGRLAKGKVDEASIAAETRAETPAEDVCVPENPPAPPLVRKAGKGRLAKGKVDEASVAAETRAETPAEDVCVQVQSPIVPVSKPRRGRKPKTPDGDALASEKDPSEANAKSEVADAPEKPTPTPVKSGRGRKLKVVSEAEPPMPAKRVRRGTADSEPQAAACPGQAPKPVRGRKAPRSLDKAEVAAPLQSDVASSECSEPIRKTRGSRKQVSADTPVRPEEADPSVLSADLMKNKRQNVPRKGKVSSQEPEPARADPKSESTDVKDEVKSAGQMPKRVTWISDLVESDSAEVTEIPVPVRRSQQRKPGVVDARDPAVEPERATAQPTKSRRGRVGKAGSVSVPVPSAVIEHPATAQCKEAVSKRVPSEPAKDVPPVAKKGVKRKLTRDEPAEGAAVDDEPSESSNPDSALKRARGRSRKEEVSVEAGVSEKRQRGPVKRAGSALECEEKHSKPAVRGRKGGPRGAQQGPKPSQGSAGETAGNQESAAGTGSTETQTRGRAKSEKKLDPASSAEVLPVRRTRRK